MMRWLREHDRLCVCVCHCVVVARPAALSEGQSVWIGRPAVRPPGRELNIGLRAAGAPPVLNTRRSRGRCKWHTTCSWRATNPARPCVWTWRRRVLQGRRSKRQVPTRMPSHASNAGAFFATPWSLPPQPSGYTVW